MKIQKTIILSIIVFIVISKLNAQSIPNGSFENWTQQIVGTQTVLTADNWLGSYTQGSTPLSPIQTTDHVDGNYGIELETTQWPIVGKTGGIVSCTFPITNKPFYINGYFKSLRVDTTGTGQVLIRLTNNGTVIGSGLFTTSTTVSAFTQFSQAITYTSNLIPDEVTIWLCSEGIFGVNTKNFGNKLWIDNLTFSNAPLSINDHQNSIESMKIYPNPVIDILNIELKKGIATEVMILNSVGQEVLRDQTLSGINKINIDFLPAGIYLLKTSTNGQSVISKFVKK